MAAALLMAGFEVWDVNMHDLKTGTASLHTFQGVVFVGGFSYADVLGSAKGLTVCHVHFLNYRCCIIDGVLARNTACE